MNKNTIEARLAKIGDIYAGLVRDLIAERPDDEAVGELPPMEQGILEALQDGKPKPGKLIAKASGYAYGGRLRRVLAKMVRGKRLTHGPDGYQLSASPESATNRNPIVNRIGMNGHHE